jgi:CheY-like chemotaxis protein
MSYLNADRTNSAHEQKVHRRNWRWLVADGKSTITGKRFLVLDDEFLIALDIQQILEGAGAVSVICAANSADALAALQAGAKIDLAVLDIKLSGASLSVAATLTAQDTPFVFLTAMREDVEMRKFPEAPVVAKPSEAPALLDAIIRALGTR